MHRCADCGFLSSYSRTQREHVEADAELREQGFPRAEPPSPWAESAASRLYRTYEKFPVCFAREVSLLNECNEVQASTNEGPEAVKRGARIKLDVIHRERTCTAFTPWKQGFSPKEHKEMLIDEIKDQLEQKFKEREHRWRWVELLVMGGVVTVVSVTAQIVAALLPVWLGAK